MAIIQFTKAQITLLFKGFRKPSKLLFSQWEDWLLQINADTGGVQDQTHAEMLAQAAALTLQPGQSYRITDFTSSILIPNVAPPVTTVGPVEPLIVTAISTSELAPTAWSAATPDDIITYDINSALFGAVTGAITFRHDLTLDLSAYFDWRVAIFRRWETAPASGIFTVTVDNFGAFQDATAFADFTGGGTTNSGCHIGQNSLAQIPPALANIVIGDSSFDINFGENNTDSTLLANCSEIVTGDFCTGIAILNNCTSINFGHSVLNHDLGTFCNGFVIGDNCGTNVFGNSCSRVTLQQACSSLIIGDINANINFGQSVSNITVGDMNTGINIGDFSTTIVIGSLNQFLTMGVDNNNHAILDSCQNIEQGNGCDSNAFGNTCIGVTYASDCSTNTMEADCTDVDFSTGVSGRTVVSDTRSRRDWVGGGEMQVNYDAAVDPITVGTHDLNGLLPDNSYLVYGTFQGTAAFTGGAGAMAAFGVAVDDPTGLMGATLMANAFFDGEPKNFDTVWTSATITAETTAVRRIVIVISGNDIITGAATMFLRWQENI